MWPVVFMGTFQFGIFYESTSSFQAHSIEALKKQTNNNRNRTHQNTFTREARQEVFPAPRFSAHRGKGKRTHVSLGGGAGRPQQRVSQGLQSPGLPAHSPRPLPLHLGGLRTAGRPQAHRAVAKPPTESTQEHAVTQTHSGPNRLGLPAGPCPTAIAVKEKEQLRLFPA